MQLREVQVVAAVGTSFGVLSDEDGVLTIVMRGPGETDWPHGMAPASHQTIQPGYTRFVVLDCHQSLDASVAPPDQSYVLSE